MHSAGRTMAISDRISEKRIDAMVDECIEKEIFEELLRDNREEVRSMLLTEYDEEAHIKSEREIALKEGEEIGWSRGIEEGERKGELRMTILLQRLIDAGRNSDIELAVKDEEARKRMYKEFGITD